MTAKINARLSLLLEFGVTALSRPSIKSRDDDSADSRPCDLLHHRHRRPCREHRDRDLPSAAELARRDTAHAEFTPGEYRSAAMRIGQLCRRYAAFDVR